MNSDREAGPLISVVIPTYNRAELVKNAVLSALNQTYSNIEVVVVIDNSQDNTREMLESISDSRARYVTNFRNLGGSASRNRGVGLATGDYIAFLDDDDEWYPEKLQRQISLIGDSGAILCAANVRSTGKIDLRYKKKSIGLGDLKRGFIFGAGSSSILAKSHLVKETMFDEGLPCNQDWDFMIRLAEKCSIVYDPTPLLSFNDGSHERITNAKNCLTVSEIETRLAAVYKHKKFLGPFWYRFHVARRLLSHIRHRDGKTRHVIYTARRSGVSAIIAVYYYRILMRLDREI